MRLMCTLRRGENRGHVTEVDLCLAPRDSSEESKLESSVSNLLLSSPSWRSVYILKQTYGWLALRSSSIFFFFFQSHTSAGSQPCQQHFPRDLLDLEVLHTTASVSPLKEQRLSRSPLFPLTLAAFPPLRSLLPPPFPAC